MARQRPTRGAPGMKMGPCIVGIDRIVIRYVQYQFEVSRCRNEEFIVKRQFWVGVIYVGEGAPWLVMGPCIIEIYRIVIRYVQYQFQVNRCKNEEFIVKGNFGWTWSMCAGVPQIEIDRIVIRDFQNEEVIVKGNFGWVWSMLPGRPRIDRIVIRDFQGSSAKDGRTDRQTDGGDNHNIPTLFKKREDKYGRLSYS
ncbi:hypothetical protein DPMN_041346 [Dreissena polymorpha]|uniref:Uncharacterized protein n=1 Tax=Dreissena polymorpha TaxID=45954 RepID=A0A9D4CXM4_DREPO|nr:hypothetical protein DPMN_041346 [Dreissena polymorpha]